MEITPAVFQAVDDYNETIAECNRRIALSQSYGLLTGSDINYQTTISDDTVQDYVPTWYIECSNQYTHFDPQNGQF